MDLKEQGNVAYKNNQFDKAVELYTQALESTAATAEGRHLILSNRAAAKLALNRFAEALEDCRQVLEIDSSFLKGYLRMAQALKGLGRIREALDACKQGLALCPPTEGKKPAGYPELARLAHMLNNEVATKKVPAAASASSEQEQEMIRAYNELEEDVQNLNALLENKVRELKTLEITNTTLDKIPKDPAPSTFVPVGRMFVQKPVHTIQADLMADMDRLKQEIELGKNKMQVSATRLKELSQEIEETMRRQE